MSRFLLEIGTEEIPDWMIVSALNQLQDHFQTFLDQNSLGGRVSRTGATPRRLVLFAEGLLARQPDTEELVLGPPKSAGPGAASGFARKMGVPADSLLTEQTPKGDYFAFRKSTPGRPASVVLAAALPDLILKIQWPKTMYWTERGGPRFIRPLRWLLALLDDEIVDFSLAGLRSGHSTFGHRLFGAGPLPVSIDTFEPTLAEHGVILSAAERRRRIESGIAALLEPRSLRLLPDPALLETLVYLTELPTPILGSFDPGFLSLPEEVLSTVMRAHQKYFSVKPSGAETHLAPHFIAVMNTAADPDGLVRHGNERVLRARFNDARFFWEQDLARPLESRLEDLKHVTFQAALPDPTYYDKTQRIAALAASLGGGADACRAALLAKCDLTCGMVKEFTELQGVMGGLYARHQGEAESVWRAVYDHYRPASMEDPIPSTREGQLVSLADKLDTLRECFRAGLIPSGSKDPFALRRAAQGVVRILAEGSLDLPLEESGPLHDFFLDRVKYYFRDVLAFQYDEVNAAVAAGWSRLPDLKLRLEALREIRPTENFEPLAASFKRIRNILKQAAYTDSAPVDPMLLEHPAEQSLNLRFKAVASALERLSGYTESVTLSASDEPVYAAMRGATTVYGKALAAIASLRPAVDEFFDKVLVNDPNPALRANRLALLATLAREFSTIADFSEIVTEKA